MNVTVFSTEHCGRCTFVKRALDKNGIEFQEILLTYDSIEQAKELRSLGYKLSPVIKVEDGDGVRFSEGYDRDFIASLAEAKAS